MGRPLPKLQRTRPFGVVSPVLENGIAYKQGDYYFDAAGNCVVSVFDEKMKARHFGEGNPEDKTLIGSSVLPSDIDLGNGSSIKLGSVVALAHRDSGLSVDDFNALDDDEREARFADVIETLKTVVQPADPKKAKASITVGAQPEKKEEAESREPEAFEPMVPDIEEPPASDEPSPPIDLKAWVRGKHKLNATDVLRAVKQQYRYAAPNMRAARQFLIEEIGIK